MKMDIHALIDLWNLPQQHPGTSGAEAAAKLLLGLYNGKRFPFDLTDLRSFDDNNLDAALTVIRADATRCEREVHQWLNAATGRTDFGERFEHLAHDYKLKGRYRGRDDLAPLVPEVLIIRRTLDAGAKDSPRASGLKP